MIAPSRTIFFLPIAVVIAACGANPSAAPALSPAVGGVPESIPAAAPPAGPSTSIASSPQVALGIPKDNDDSDDLLIDEHEYVLSYNAKREVANWVAWRLDEHDLGDADRSDDFRSDGALPAGVYHVAPNDYARSGFDRGHLCPSADRTDTAADNSLTFLMSNIHPQRPELNRVTWKALEEHERVLAKQHRELYIVAGGIFDAHPTTIGHGVEVPRADYKIVVVLDAGQGVESVTATTQVIAVVMPNDPSVKEKPWSAYVTSVDEVERQSGYDFLSAVPEAVQKVIESRVAVVQ